MKNLFAFLLLLPTAFAASQTEVWRVQGNYYVTLQDDRGNTYLTRHDPEIYGPADTLIKVDASGAVLWKTAVPAMNFRLLQGGSGVYVTPQLYVFAGSVHYFDSSGTLRWSYPLPDMAMMVSFPATDRDGNIVLAYDSSYPGPTRAKLLKLTPAGERVFEVPVLQVEAGNEGTVLGPVITTAGDIWILTQAQFVSQTIKSIGSAYTVIGDEEAMLFNGRTGALYLRRQLFRQPVDQAVDDGRGNTRESNLNNGGYGGPTMFLVTSNGSLVAGGTYDVVTNKCRSNGMCRMDQKSEWRMTIVDPSGKVSPFRYRGRANFRGSDAHSTYTTDNDGNTLAEIVPAATGILYLHGMIARGTSVNNSGDEIYDDLVMKFDAASRKIVWRIARTLPAGEALIPAYFYEPSQVLLRPRTTRIIDVISSYGGVSPTPLSFPDEVALPAQSGVYAVRNIEPGFLILWGSDCSTTPCRPFTAKYAIGAALAAQQFAQPTALSEPEAPGAFVLRQNYPNPFNPVTTIEFELGSEALVSINVYNELGQEVATLADQEPFGEGVNMVDFDAAGLPSGVYFCSISAHDAATGAVALEAVRKMILAK